MKALTIHQPWATLCVTRQPCATCSGSGLVWRASPTTPRRANPTEPCTAAFRCPDCPDDGSGNSKGTGQRAVKWIETRSWPAPAALIGQRIAIHASAKRPENAWPWPDGKPFTMWLDEFGARWLQRYEFSDLNTVTSYDEWPLPLGAVVGSAVLSACVPMVEDVDDFTESIDCIELSGESAYLWRAGEDERPGRSVRDQRPFGIFEPGRYAWLLADAAPTTERCPFGCRPGEAWWNCRLCKGNGRCDPIPARGRQRVWEWTP